ncbi:802_t:CDS:2 [Funneliformis geosporum]|nr:802_t:CDS:2 [Funneliformis geosporum]
MEEGDVFTGKTFGIITDAEKWNFMEYLQAKVERILKHIACLLEEAQKSDSDSQSKERVIKKHRSSSNLTDK